MSTGQRENRGRLCEMMLVLMIEMDVIMMAVRVMMMMVMVMMMMTMMTPSVDRTTGKSRRVV